MTAFRLMDYPDIELETVKSATKAQFAYCEECDTSIHHHSIWPLSKSAWLHENGTGHRVTFLRFKP